MLQNNSGFFCKVLRKKATHLDESEIKVIANKEATDHGERNFTGCTDVTPIVDRLYGSLYQFAIGLTRSESDAADLVQQTFLSLSQRLHQIRDFSKIKCWLFLKTLAVVGKKRSGQRHAEGSGCGFSRL